MAIACSTVLFLLVVARMAQLLRQVEAQAALLRELAASTSSPALPNRRAWMTELGPPSSAPAATAPASAWP